MSELPSHSLRDPTAGAFIAVVPSLSIKPWRPGIGAVTADGAAQVFADKATMLI